MPGSFKKNYRWARASATVSYHIATYFIAAPTNLLKAQKVGHEEVVVETQPIGITSTVKWGW